MSLASCNFSYDFFTCGRSHITLCTGYKLVIFMLLSFLEKSSWILLVLSYNAYWTSILDLELKRKIGIRLQFQS